MARALDLEPKNFETDEPKRPKLLQRVKASKNICHVGFQNLDQGPDGALKIVFLNMSRTLEGIPLWT